MKTSTLSQENQNLYWIGWCLLGVGFCLILIQQMLHVSILGMFPECMMRHYLGLYCPGCGGTRAVVTLLQGDIRSSLHFHPVILYTVILYLWFMISNTIQIASKGKIAIGLKYRNLYVYIALVIVLINWIFKNYMLIRYGITLTGGLS
jgi:hypothetical protein